MPRRIDYSVRYAFLNEAAFTIVLEQGVGKLSRQNIARILGTSESTVRRLVDPATRLERLAVREIADRRRRGRLFRPAGSDEEVALALLVRTLADQPQRIAEELVWWKLILERPAPHARVTHPRAGEGTLRERFRIAERGYDDSPPREEDETPEPEDPLAGDVETHDAGITSTLTSVLGLLGCPDADMEIETVRLRALVDGLNLGICLGRITPDEAIETLSRHLAVERTRRRPDDPSHGSAATVAG